MKSKIETKKFQPVVVTLTFESQEDLNAFYLITASLVPANIKPTQDVKLADSRYIVNICKHLFNDIAYPLLQPEL